MIARPSAKFARPRVHASLLAKPYEQRIVCVLPTNQDSRSSKCSTLRCRHTKLTRSRVANAVARDEMTWIDPFNGLPTKRATNLATYTETACGTWQKTRSGHVCTMQLKVGEKGRHVPAGQREPELVLA